MSVSAMGLRHRADAHDDVECRVRGLTVHYQLEQGRFAAIRDLDLDIHQGQITALIGESGSGKTTLGLSLLNGIQEPGQISHGSIEFRGKGDILKKAGEDLRHLRGRHVGMVFQAAQNSLNPLKRVGSIVLDLARSHEFSNPRALLHEAAQLAERMSLNADRVLTSYQHELSGGMRQRVSIILALILSPEVLILDEPTTALDVLSQSTVLKIVRDIQQERNLTTVLITHDMGVVAELADRVCVMYAGRIVEQGRTADILQAPRHPYTRALIRAIPRLTGAKDRAQPLKGAPPDLTSIPEDGCVFRNRCAFAMDSCAAGAVRQHVLPNEHTFACNLEEDAE